MILKRSLWLVMGGFIYFKLVKNFHCMSFSREDESADIKAEAVHLYLYLHLSIDYQEISSRE